MDIERMKKINSMIPELKKQGFAKNNREAAIQSDAIFKHDDKPSVIEETSNVYGETAAPQQEAKNQPEPAVEPVSSTSSPELLAKVGALEEKVGNLENDVTAIIEKLNEMIGVISELEQAKGQIPSGEAQPKETQKKIAEPEKKEPHARSGNYTSADVDINKIFYYGNK